MRYTKNAPPEFWIQKLLFTLVFKCGLVIWVNQIWLNSESKPFQKIEYSEFRFTKGVFGIGFNRKGFMRNRIRIRMIWKWYSVLITEAEQFKKVFGFLSTGYRILVFCVRFIRDRIRDFNRIIGMSRISGSLYRILI